MPGHDVIVVGASAGGVEALSTLAAGLPADLAASVLVVLHVKLAGGSVLPKILDRAGPLPAAHPFDGQALEPGKLYVAPPGQHMLVEPGKIRLVAGPHENRQRPAIDPTLRTAAAAYGPRVVGVVMSGVLDDGTAGLLAVKRHGGIAVVQDPNEAAYPDMPLSALQHVKIDWTLSAAEIPALLVRLAAEEVEARLPARVAPDDVEAVMDRRGIGSIEETASLGQPSSFQCPDCHGPLWELKEGSFARFRCHVGHAYTLDNLALAQGEDLERALWAAIRSLQTTASISRRMAARANTADPARAESFNDRAAEAEKHVAMLRRIVLDLPLTGLPLLPT